MPGALFLTLRPRWQTFVANENRPSFFFSFPSFFLPKVQQSSDVLRKKEVARSIFKSLSCEKLFQINVLFACDKTLKCYDSFFNFSLGFLKVNFNHKRIRVRMKNGR